MKKLLTLIAVLFITAPAYAQDKIEVTVKKEQSLAEIIQAGQANATAAAAAMSDASTTIKVPLTVNFKDYTHIAIVDVQGPTGKRGKAYFKRAYQGLLSSPLTIINPTSNKKKFKTNSFYLRDTKNPKWLYLYLTGSRIGVDSSITAIIRDYENNMVYSATTLNVGFYEVMTNIANF